jgi:hypothetical protein
MSCFFILLIFLGLFTRKDQNFVYSSGNLAMCRS